MMVPTLLVLLIVTAPLDDLVLKVYPEARVVVAALRAVSVAAVYLVGNWRFRRSLRGWVGRVTVSASVLLLWMTFELSVPSANYTAYVFGLYTMIYFIPLALLSANTFGPRLGTLNRAISIYALVVATGVVLSATLGDSAPEFLSAVDPNTAHHSFGPQRWIYLAPGLFSAAEESANHILFGLFLAAARLAIRPSRGAAFTAMFLTAAILLSGRRGSFYAAIIGAALVYIWASSNGGVPRRRHGNCGKAIAGVLAAGGCAAIMVLVFSGSALGGFFTERAGVERTVLTILESPDGGYRLEGRGPGVASLGFNEIAEDWHDDPRDGLIPKVAQELGVVGVALYGVVLAVTLRGPRLPRRKGRTTGDDEAMIARTAYTIAAAAVIGLSLKTHPILNPQLSIVLWTCFGAGIAARIELAKGRTS